MPSDILSNHQILEEIKEIIYFEISQSCFDDGGVKVAAKRILEFVSETFGLDQ